MYRVLGSINGPGFFRETAFRAYSTGDGKGSSLSKRFYLKFCFTLTDPKPIKTFFVGNQSACGNKKPFSQLTHLIQLSQECELKYVFSRKRLCKIFC